MEPRTITVILPASPKLPSGAEVEIPATEYEARNKKSIEMFGAPLKLTPESAQILVDEMNPPDSIEPTSAERALMGVQAFGEGAMQGASLGVGDRMQGLAKGTAAAVRGEPFLPAYRAGEEKAREDRDFAVEQAGMLPQIAGNIVGGAALAPLAGAGMARLGAALPAGAGAAAGTATNLGARVASGAKLGAAQGALTGALAAPSTGSTGDTLLEGALAALLGGVTGGALPVAAGAARTVGDLITGAGRGAKAAVGAAKGAGEKVGQALRGEAALSPQDQALVDAAIDTLPGGRMTSAMVRRWSAGATPPPRAPLTPQEELSQALQAQASSTARPVPVAAVPRLPASTTTPQGSAAASPEIQALLRAAEPQVATPTAPDWLAPSNLDLADVVPTTPVKAPFTPEPAFTPELAALMDAPPPAARPSTPDWLAPSGVELADIVPTAPRGGPVVEPAFTKELAALMDAPKPVAPPAPAATPAPVAAPKGRTPEARSASAKKAAETRARNRAKALEELAKEQGAAPAEAKAAAAQVVAATPDAPAPAAKGKPVPDDVEALQALLASPGEAPMPLAPRPKPAETVVRAKRGQAAPAPAAVPQDDLTLLAQERAAPQGRVVAPDEEGALAELQKRRALSEMAAGGLQEPSPIVQDPTLLAPKRVSSKPRAKVLRPELETTPEEKELSELQRQVMKDAQAKFGERVKVLQEQFGKLEGNAAALAERDDIIDEAIQEALRNNERLAGFISPPQRRIFDAIKSGAADVQDIQDATQFTKGAIDQELRYLRRFGFITKDEAEKFAMRRADVGVKP